MVFNRSCIFLCFLLSFFAVRMTDSFNFDVCSPRIGEHLKVTFGALNINCNSPYPLNTFTSPPTITFAKADKTKLYEVLMLDPDAPSKANPRCRSWIHLVLSDVLGSDLLKGVSVNSAVTVATDYNPPTPPKGTGYHRYVFVIFSHTGKLKLDQISDRCHFDVEEFARAHHLSEIPDATNMFKTKQP